MVPTNVPHAVTDSGQQVLLLLILGILDQLCSSAVFCRVDGPVRPVRFSHMFVGADAHIGPYRPVRNIGTNSYRESYSFAPEEGVQAAERPKNRARQRAI